MRLRNAQKIIESIGKQLNLEPGLINSGKRYYKDAYDKNFIQGRVTREVGAVCLYIACRVGKSYHLLIDFQDAIQVNVFKLGSIFLELNQKFYLNLPQIDPSLYINRFCSRLEFDTKKNQVVNSALRILQSMNRAWLQVGRRPNGLCGAAILIAARFHGFKRTIGQIVRVVHVCQETIRKRLDEFKGTNTAQLTREELQSIESSHPIDSTIVHPKMIESMDPPAFTKNILKRTLQIENGAQLDQLMHTMEEKAQVIEQKLLKYESKDSDIIGDEEQKQSDNQQLVVYQGHLTSKGEHSDFNYSDSHLVPNMTGESVSTAASNLSHRTPYPASTISMLPSFQNPTDEDEYGIISLSDVDDDAIESMILTEEEAKLKKNIWDNLNRDWIKAQKNKRRVKKEERRRQKESKRKDKELRKRLDEERKKLQNYNDEEKASSVL